MRLVNYSLPGHKNDFPQKHLVSCSQEEYFNFNTKKTNCSFSYGRYWRDYATCTKLLKRSSFWIITWISQRGNPKISLNKFVFPSSAIQNKKLIKFYTFCGKIKYTNSGLNLLVLFKQRAVIRMVWCPDDDGKTSNRPENEISWILYCWSLSHKGTFTNDSNCFVPNMSTGEHSVSDRSRWIESGQGPKQTHRCTCSESLWVILYIKMYDRKSTGAAVIQSPKGEMDRQPIKVKKSHIKNALAPLYTVLSCVVIHLHNTWWLSAWLPSVGVWF